MRSANEVPAEYLVVDSGAFIKRAPLQDLGAVICTIADVLDELKCEKSRHLIESVPYEIVTKEPTSESIKIVGDVAKKTGDYAVLSLVDLKVLALTHDLYTQHCSKDNLKYGLSVPKTTEVSQRGISDPPESDKVIGKTDENLKTPYETVDDEKSLSNIAGFYQPSTNKKDAAEDEASPEESCSDSSGDEDGWVDETNIDGALRRLGAIAVPETNVKVACITTDFAMQNVLLHIGLPLLSLEGFRIRRLKSYVLRCRTCYGTTSDMQRKFCKSCGNETLHRVAVTVNDDGSMQLHINWNRLKSTRGLRYSLPAPKGGKHAKDPQLFEDQRMPHNRMAKREMDPLSVDPFAMIDVSSRSAALGLRSLQSRGRSNPNVPKGGKKRGSKRR